MENKSPCNRIYFVIEDGKRIEKFRSIKNARDFVKRYSWRNLEIEEKNICNY